MVKRYKNSFCLTTFNSPKPLLDGVFHFVYILLARFANPIIFLYHRVLFNVFGSFRFHAILIFTENSKFYQTIYSSKPLKNIDFSNFYSNRN